MSSFNRVLARYARQPILYWQKVTSDGYGKPTYLTPSTPAQFNVHLEDKQREILTYDKRKVISRGFIMSATPIIPGSLVFFGTLAQWQALPNYPSLPTVNEGAHEILLVDTPNDPKNYGTTYEAYV